MIILGLPSPVSWDQSAAIVKDGKFLACVEEERYLRLKHAPRFLPELAIDFCLKFAKAKPENVDIVAIGERSPLDTYLRSAWENIKEADFLRIPQELYGAAVFLGGMARLYRWMTHRGFRMKCQNKVRFVFIPHHQAHAASAYRCSGFNDSNILTIDGQGEDDSGSIWYGKGTSMTKLKKYGHHQSIGQVYEEFTDFLGFKRHSHEGKVMGLAAYGKKNLANSYWWEVAKESYKINSGWLKRLEQTNLRRQKEDLIKDCHKDLAFTVQRFTDQAGVAIAKQAKLLSKSENICLSGGVALNCNMNSKIWGLPFVKKIFIQPASGDAGTAIGAALEAANQIGENADFKMTNAYWGPEYSRSEIEKELKEAKVEYHFLTDIQQYVAKELAEGKIVGWFQGRSELGPRALGNRSILAHPGMKGMKDKINNEVKHREYWRPFAPSILDEVGKNI
jgi:carbamoyltransferase